MSTKLIPLKELIKQESFEVEAITGSPDPEYAEGTEMVEVIAVSELKSYCEKHDSLMAALEAAVAIAESNIRIAAGSFPVRYLEGDAKRIHNIKEKYLS